jgi:hypothetical protein
VVKASASRTGNLTKPDFSFAAKRFLRWRKKQPKVRIKFGTLLAVSQTSKIKVQPIAAPRF